MFISYISGLGSALKLPGFADGGLYRPQGCRWLVSKDLNLRLLAWADHDSDGQRSSAMSRYSLRTASNSWRQDRYGGRGLDGISTRPGEAPMGVSMNYNGPTMVFDNERYVPVEALPGIVKQAAGRSAQSVACG